MKLKLIALLVLLLILSYFIFSRKIEIEEKKLNNLLKILTNKEKEFYPILNRLKVISFKNLSNQSKLNQYSHFLKVQNNQVLVTENFLSYLKNKTNYNDKSIKIKSESLKVKIYIILL